MKRFAAAVLMFSLLFGAACDGDPGSSTVDLFDYEYKNVPLPPPGTVAPQPKPKTTGDTQAPTVGFALPATSTSPVVALSFVAADNVGVTGYALTTTVAAPALSSLAWSTSAPANYTFTAAGMGTLVAWAKDAAGNISSGAIDTVMLSDTTAPVVGTFAVPATSTSTAVTVTTLTATDDFGVTGYLVNESATKPAAGASGWTATKPTTYTATAGAHTLYAWAKDAAGNVSESRSAAVTVTLP